jgi:hypothetical protein
MTGIQYNPKKWVSFTYVGKETSLITKIFKGTDLRIAYHTTNTLQKHLTHRNPISDKFTCSGVYKLTCPDCKKAYIGQTGRNFYTRFNEHKSAFKYNTSQSKFAHLSTNGHTFDSITNTMEVLQIHKKGIHLQGVRKRLYLSQKFFFGPLLFGGRHLENFVPTGTAGISIKSRSI